MAKAKLTDKRNHRANLWREVISDLNSPLSLAFESQLDLFGRDGFLAPAAIIEAAPRKYLHVTFAVTDERLGRELKKLRDALVKRKLTKPRVTFEFNSKVTCAQLISRESRRRRSRGQVVSAAQFRIRFTSKNRDLLSPFLGAQLILLALSDRYNFFLFDCHSHWEMGYDTPGVFGPYTLCHDTGPCPAPQRCLCLDAIHGARTTCQGWQVCACS